MKYSTFPSHSARPTSNRRTRPASSARRAVSRPRAGYTAFTKSLPVPIGNTASAGRRSESPAPMRPLTTSWIVPSPPAATSTDASRATASRASSAPCPGPTVSSIVKSMRRAASSRSISARARRPLPPPATGFRITTARPPPAMRRAGSALPERDGVWLRGFGSGWGSVVTAPRHLGDDRADDVGAEAAARQVGVQAAPLAQPLRVALRGGRLARCAAGAAGAAAPRPGGRPGQVQLGHVLRLERLLDHPDGTVRPDAAGPQLGDEAAPPTRLAPDALADEGGGE